MARAKRAVGDSVICLYRDGMISLGFSPRPLKEAFFQHARVVHALMLRDIKTRFGASYFGFLAGLFLPLAHIGIIMTMYIVMGRRAPIGTDVALYLSTAILPFIVWSYTHQKIMQSFGQNRSLTSFPIVKFTDIVIARSMVELLNVSIIVMVVSLALHLFGSDLFIFDSTGALLTLVMAYSLGVSTGFIFGLISVMLPAVMLVGFVFIPLYWVTSGVFFIPESLPEPARQVISYFPLSHIVDFGRTSFYSTYLSSYSNLAYVFMIIAINIVIGLAAEHFLRATLTTK